jgi:hypothetical protein
MSLPEVRQRDARTFRQDDHWRSGKSFDSNIIGYFLRGCPRRTAFQIWVDYRNLGIAAFGQNWVAPFDVAYVLCSLLIFATTWRHWFLWEPIEKSSKVPWLLFMIVGFWYGSLIYYLFKLRPSSIIHEREMLA